MCCGHRRLGHKSHRQFCGSYSKLDASVAPVRSNVRRALIEMAIAASHVLEAAGTRNVCSSVIM